MTITGFKGMFGDSWPAPVRRIEIPIFQRDYAQGREEEAEVREAFVSALCRALRPDAKPLGLDFVYGEVQGGTGTLVPLDGQQRLTTLFLLHWYVARRAGVPVAGESWTEFAYRTRPSAELFCRRLVQQLEDRSPIDEADPAAWIREQPWFLFQWQFDPTIQGMLVVITSIANTCAALGIDFPTAWERLSGQDPAIWFHYRPIDDMGAETELYIKMNSRGKPLTRWETVKAHFEEAISWTGSAYRHRFALGFDQAWSDVLWRLPDGAGSPEAMDARFLRYFSFLTDLCQWSAGPAGEELLHNRPTLAQRVTALYGEGAGANLEFLFASFDVWTTRDPVATFRGLYRPAGGPNPAGGQGPLPLFFDETDLFVHCCDHYGTEKFTVPHTLILYATLVHLTDPGAPAADSFAANVRILRNLIRATSIQRKDLPRLVPEVRRLIRTGELSDVSGFNRVQVAEEQAKRRLLAGHQQDPDLVAAMHDLEDHRLLRGTLAAFDLGADAEVFTRRARTFAQVFADGTDRLALSGALLAHGDYGWERSSSHRQYGTGDTGDAPWRELLTNNDQQDRLQPTRAVLMSYLDEAAESPAPAQHAHEKTRQWLQEHTDGPFDWRYYFNRYSAMRTGTSGVFHLPDGRDRLVGRRMQPGQTHRSSKQRDPYLVAIRGELGADGQHIAEQRAVGWMELSLYVKDDPKVRLLNVPHGFTIRMPEAIWPRLEEHLRRLPVEVGAPETDEGGSRIAVHVGIPRHPGTPTADGIDRVKVGAALCQAMADSVRDAAG